MIPVTIITTLALLTAITLLLYLFIQNRHRYWLQKNVPYLKPKHFLFGNTAEVIIKKIPLAKYHAKIYNELAPHKYGGYFNFIRPVFLIRDPDLIRIILTKDFSYFTNRGDAFIDDKEPLTLHLFSLGGELWKNLRAKITPAFSSSKMKIMFNLMKACTDELLHTVDRETQENGDVEVKELMSRFTTDVISSCVFGLESSSLKDPDAVIRKMGKQVFEASTRNRIIGILNTFSPKLRRLLRLRLISKELNDFFQSLVKDTIKYRQENNVSRNDFLDLLIALKHEDTSLKSPGCNNDVDQGNKKFELSDDLLTAQCFVFFVAGFETSSSTLTFALYELAKHEAIQEKLYEEITRVLENFNNELTYECLQNMTYLEQVVNETLRMYPIIPFLIRVCERNYHIADSEVVIEKGTRVIIPTLGLHYDSQYYDSPCEFNPENFTKDAKSKRHHFTYLPFGEGPRICIGMRFGLMQVKLSLATLIKNYSFNISPKTSIPIKLQRNTILTSVEDGMWLTCSKRKT